MKSRNPIIKIVIDAHTWQKININGREKKLMLYFSNTQWVILFLGILFHFKFRLSLNTDFVGYAISALSIFTGLFLTLILSVYDKYHNIFFTIDVTKLNEEEKIELIQDKNYFKKFTVMMSYAILISVFCIVLLSLNVTNKDFFKDDFLNYHLVDYQYWEFKYVKKFIKLLIISIYNIATLYFLFDLVLIILYGLGALYSYYMKELDKTKVIKK